MFPVYVRAEAAVAAPVDIFLELTFARVSEISSNTMAALTGLSQTMTEHWVCKAASEREPI